MDRPKTLFKFEPFNEQTLKNLKNQEVYFSSPKRFNDPFDCDMSPTYTVPTDSAVVFIQTKLREKGIKECFPPEDIKKLELMTTAEIQTIAINAAKNELEKFRVKFRETRGICCFSDEKGDLLMWAHYASSYQGFCLEFDTSFLPFTVPYKVVYQEELPQMDVTLINTEEDPDVLQRHIFQLFCTKSKSWEYEREWRCIHEKADQAFKYKRNALKAIYFGPNMKIENLRSISLILQKHNPNVELWRGERSSSKFKVEFEKLN
ncbi:DUF2971 domain-containing protein [Shewanella abyssi]|uniref:DUF2971 domain-containing protein n=1 Tax=Shewanella abyssi TaxID=311789 RepID=UPI0020106153|nr:DUF2971 domain-containing protein [Shewanella abyssi]MCL1048438.1 DUF2971 domain-containing protein [Shewanella abyssi]